MPEPTIIAIGGVGELGPDDTEPIDRFIIAQTHVAQPRVLFIPTASRDDLEYCDRFTHWYTRYGCMVEILPLTAHHPHRYPRHQSRPRRLSRGTARRECNGKTIGNARDVIRLLRHS